MQHYIFLAGLSQTTSICSQKNSNISKCNRNAIIKVYFVLVLCVFCFFFFPFVGHEEKKNAMSCDRSFSSAQFKVILLIMHCTLSIHYVCRHDYIQTHSTETKFQLQNLTGIWERNYWLFRDQQVIFCLTVLRKNILPTINRQNVICQWKLQKSISWFFFLILKIDLIFSVN